VKVARRARNFSLLSIVISALCAMVAARMAWQDPRYLLPFFLIAVLSMAPALLARRRMRRLLMSGDVQRVLGTWAGSMERVTYPETMAPLMIATAYASYGWIDAARAALARAAKGPAWEAALEQRLFVETLLDTFEGDREGAIEKARVLEKMPIPSVGLFTSKRVARLRRGMTALARAFAHESTAQDAGALLAAGRASPLIHWAMRYAAAIVLVDQGKSSEVRALLEGAPEWPKESAFRVFHEELLAQAAV
jgi:hypothetical protein